MKKDQLAVAGNRIRLINMPNDPNPVKPGTEGTIDHVDGIGTIHVTWDDGRTIGVIPGEDEYQILPPNDTELDLLSIFGEGLKSTKGGERVKNTFKKEFAKTNPRITNIKFEDEIKGGLADKMTPKKLAKKHGVPIKDIEKEIEVGTEIEKEHVGDDLKKAKEIAMDHIYEFPDYYTNKKYGLKASEKGLEKIHENLFKSIKNKFLGKKKVATDYMGYVKQLKEIAKHIDSAKPTQKDSLLKMVDNFQEKFKDHDMVNDISKELRKNINDKFGVDEMTTTGSVGGSFVQPIGKPVKRQKVYEPKNENIIVYKDLVNEATSTRNTDRTDAGGPGYDGNTWAYDDGWLWNDKPLWKKGEIVDLLAKKKVNWKDSDLSLNEVSNKDIHKEKWKRCVEKVKKNSPEVNPYAVCTDSIGYEGSIKKAHRRMESLDEGISDKLKVAIKKVAKTIKREVKETYLLIKALYKLAKNGVGKNKELTDTDVLELKKFAKEQGLDLAKALPIIAAQTVPLPIPITPVLIALGKKMKIDIVPKEQNIPNKLNKKKDVDETTTHASVWGVNGPPVTPAFAAKKGKHKLSNKPIWKGGTIVQKINNDGVLNEVNDKKYVDGGKFVKIKDKCSKYRNQPWCSQGAIDDPLQLSDTTFENIEKVSKEMGMNENEVLNKIKAKLKGVSKKQLEYNKKHGLPLDWRGSVEGYREKMDDVRKYSGSN